MNTQSLIFIKFQLKNKSFMKIIDKFLSSPNIPLIFSIFIYTSLCLAYFIIIIQYTDNHFVYPLDDTYVHMAIAKNFSKYGVWGIDQYKFTSTSSSPLWTLILSITYFIFGVNDYSPLILNFIISLFVLYYLNRYAKLYNLNNYETFTLSVMAIFFIPLIVLTFLGLEHTLHCLLILLFINAFIQYDSNNTNVEGKNSQFKKMLIMIPFLVMTRYESLFPISAVILVTLYRKNFSNSLKIILITILSILIYGLISIKNGWYLFPNTLFLKSNFSIPPQLDLYLITFKGLIKFLFKIKNLLLIVLPALFLVILIKINFQIRRDAFIYFFILILSLVFHLIFAKFGWFYRYETYLILMGMVLIFFISKRYVIKINPFKSRIYNFINKTLLNLLLILIIYNFIEREYFSLRLLPQASKNIYQQQFQMAKFISKYFNNYTIALNDIGAVCYYADVRCIDLFGLANLDVLNAKRSKIYNTSFIEKLVNKENVKLAIIYDTWFQGKISPPESWIKIGEWKIYENVICGSDVVSFYIVDKFFFEDINKKFRSYSKNLPDGISYRINFDYPQL